MLALARLLSSTIYFTIYIHKAKNKKNRIVFFECFLIYFKKIQVAFNLITHNSIKKVLSRLCKQEKCDVSAEHIDLIAKASGGDIRHAITSLQYFSLKLNQMHAFSSSTSTCSEEKPDLIGMLDAGISLQFGRDETLSLFHALGKFLHNKRDSEIAMELGTFIVFIFCYI